MALNARQKIFVKEYLKDKNATRSAKAAGYSAKTASSIGERLLRHVEIRKAVDAGLERLAKACDFSAERTLKRIAEFAFDKTGIKASDTLKACDMLGKYNKLFNDNPQVSIKLEDAPVVILPAKKNG